MIKKWGFGIAPLKSSTEYKNKYAIAQTLRYINKQEVVGDIEIENHLSHLKGMFNRIIRQDQWDWFTVNMYFDYPSIRELRHFVGLLTQLRKSIMEFDEKEIEKIIGVLKATNFEIYLKNYQNHDENENSKDEYIYILSRREEKELLKIGMTTRDVIKRCNEINNSTGIVYPFAPRKAIRVTDARAAEKAVHAALQTYRVRSDREFFLVSFGLAVDIIEDTLRSNGYLYYKYN